MGMHVDAASDLLLLSWGSSLGLRPQLSHLLMRRPHRPRPTGGAAGWGGAGLGRRAGGGARNGPTVSKVLCVPHGLLSPAELLASLHRPALPHSLSREAQSSSRIQDGNLKAVPRVLHTHVPVSLRAPPSLPSGMS